MEKEPFYPNKIIPILLTAIVCLLGILVLWLEITILNHFTGNSEKIIPTMRIQDILIGFTIYLKTAIDFAIFIGRLMANYPGWKNRIMIQAGTGLGNIAGTLLILLLWSFFREIKLLMAVMIVIAGLVLFKLAEGGLEHTKNSNGEFKIKLKGFVPTLESGLHRFNKVFAPLLNFLIPHADMKSTENKGYWPLFILCLTVPFILGLDDFAGYIPLFNVVNVFGFASGVFIGHALLNTALFISPHTTTKVVNHPVIALLGSIAFIGIALWGLVEAWHLIEPLLGI